MNRRSIFNEQVTDVAETNKVLYLVGILIIVCAKLAKWLDVMNVKLTPVLLLGYTASLAGVVIAATDVASLRSPVRAVIGKMTAFPVKISLSRDAFLKLGLAFSGAKSPAFAVALRDAVNLSANFTCFVNALLSVRKFLFEIWLLHSSSRQGDVFTETFLRAKTLAGISVLGNFFSANLAKHFSKIGNSKIGFGVYRCRAFTGAEFTGPRFVIFKNLSAGGAGGCLFCTRANGFALARTIHFILAAITGRKETKRFAAYGADISFVFSGVCKFHNSIIAL